MWVDAVLLVAAAVLLYVGVLRPLGHWRRRGLPYAPSLPFVGNYLRALLMKASAGEILCDIYKQFEGEPAVGVFQFGEPAVLIRDPELVKSVLVKDFAHFSDNVFPVDPKLDPLLAKNPFTLKGDKWKKTRSQLTPAFTSGKMRVVLPLIQEVCQEFVALLRREGPKSLPGGVDVEEVTARFTTDVVASVAFGLQAHCLDNPEAEVRRVNRRILEPSPLRALQITLSLFVPSLASVMRVRLLPEDVDKYFRQLVHDALDFRQRTGFSRNDYLQLLLQLRQKQIEAGNADYGEEEITAHALTFFVDGFQTSSVALSFLLHDLAHAPDRQERLRTELRALDPQDLEAPLHAPYLDACLMETLRLHPPGMFLRKECTQPYRLPNGVMVRKGEQLVIPLLALHTDENLHSQALQWRPERWLPENGGPPAKFTCLPFGEGPRQCLGMRFAQAQVKMGAAALVTNFRIGLTPKSPPGVPPLDPKNFLYAAKGGLWLRFDPL